MGHDTHVSGVRFFDNRLEHLRGQLWHRAAPVVDPNLDEFYTVPLKLLDSGSPRGRAARPPRNAESKRLLGASHRGGGNAAARGEESCRAGERSVAQLEGQRV